MTDIKSLLKLAKRRQTTEQVCLRGDLAGEYEDLERQLAKLPKLGGKLSGDPERSRIQADMDRIRDEMQAATVPFVLQALSDPAFQSLADEHPPRRDGDEIDARDAELGYNRSTFYRALIRACTVEPSLDDEDWALLFSDDVGLSAGQMLGLSIAAGRVNGQKVDVPFSSADSNENPD